MKVARNAPTMPSTVVRMKPLGLLGPGESSRAIMPAMKPTTMIQIMPLMTVVLLEKPDWKIPALSSGLILKFASLLSGHLRMSKS